jgi:predicted RNA-binding Zn ribbon-like protein
MAGAREWTFNLSGGALCLDFTNTLGDRPRGRDEHLPDFAGLLSFARQAGVLPPAAARRLRRRAAGQPRRAQQAFRRARELREGLYRVFAALAHGRGPAAGDLDALNQALVRALPHARLRPRGAGFTWAWPEDSDQLDQVLWPVARSAAELLAAPGRPPLRECGSATCSWLFLDTSRGGRRRWCDMRICGNRQKARQHYRRQRLAAAAAEPR